MERKAKGKGYKKPGAPFGMFGMPSTSKIGIKRHKKAHEKLGMGGTVEEEDKTKSEVETPVEIKEGPGKPPVNKKEE